MRHLKHHFQLGVKQSHRKALMANLASQLILHTKIRTSITKAKALRPFIEKIITLSKNAFNATQKADKLHYRRLAISRIRNKDAVKKLFDETVEKHFLKRNGGYTRIYKLSNRVGDGAPMAIIEFVETKEERRSSTKAKSSSSTVQTVKIENSENNSVNDAVKSVEKVDKIIK